MSAVLRFVVLYVVPVASFVTTVGANLVFVLLGNDVYDDTVFPLISWQTAALCVVVFCALDMLLSLCVLVVSIVSAVRLWKPVPVGTTGLEPPNNGVAVTERRARVQRNRAHTATYVLPLRALGHYPVLCLTTLHWAAQFLLGESTVLHKTVAALLIAEKGLMGFTDLWQVPLDAEPYAGNVQAQLAFRVLPDIILSLIGVSLYFCWNYFLCADEVDFLSALLLASNALSFVLVSLIGLVARRLNRDAFLRCSQVGRGSLLLIVALLAALGPALLLFAFITQHEQLGLDYTAWFLSLMGIILGLLLLLVLLHYCKGSIPLESSLDRTPEDQPLLSPYY